jgi:hypothetical protein
LESQFVGDLRLRRESHCPAVFVKSCDNDANLFTKNVSKDTYTKHMDNFLGKMEDSNE